MPTDGREHSYVIGRVAPALERVSRRALRSGDLIIVGREGSTPEYRIRGLHNPRRAQMIIARKLRVEA